MVSGRVAEPVGLGAKARLEALERLASDQLRKLRLGMHLLATEHAQWSVETAHRLRGVAHQAQRISEAIGEAIAEEEDRLDLWSQVEALRVLHEKLIHTAHKALALLN